MALSTGSKVFGLMLLGVVGGVLVVLFVGFTGEDGGDAAAGEPITIEVPEGAAADQVAQILADEGVIDNTFSFRAATRLNEDLASQIQPGVYELRAGMSSEDILQTLTSDSNAPAFTVTIPEGLTVEQTLETIADADGSPFSIDALREALAGVAVPAWVPGDLPEQAEPFEGLLAPDTYEWREDVEPQELLGELVAETEQRVSALDVPEEATYETLIIASLIEREVRVPDERPLVSSVIHNRIANDRLLQIDAAVRYANIMEGNGNVVDTDVESPWNTYAQRGLPPTPIAAPGVAALQAAADPAETDFLYYVVCDVGTGEHAFTQTNDQHVQNVARYREIQGQESGSFCDEAV
jgi:UPF0755 protein